MKSLTNEEYLALCQSLVDKQYDSATDNYDVNKMEWIPSEPEIKQKIKEANRSGMIDLTTVHSSKIKEELTKCTNIKIGNFKMRINKSFGNLVANGLTYSVEVWEERHKTPNGMPCKIDYPMIFSKDSRFKNRPWLEHFKNGSCAYKVPLDTIVDIVRWMQAIKKMSAFL